MAILITPDILHDQPLDPAQLAERAGFHFDDYANTLARLIANPTTHTPLAIGISGKWGSGKTTLLKRIRAKLEKTTSPGNQKILYHIESFAGIDPDSAFRRCRTVWFSAWKYADEDELLIALVRVIVQAMSEDDVVSKLWGKILDPSYPRRDVIATILNWFAIKIPGLDIQIDINKFKTETPFSEKAALLDLFSSTFDQLIATWVHRSLDVEKVNPERGVLVVFIDDLDRCLPEKTIQVLEAIKLFLDRPGTVFVLAADEDVVRSAIEAHYENKKIVGQQASDYLEKIFQIRFELPPLSNIQVRSYLAENLKGLDSELMQSLDLIIAGAEANPRQIKTFLNYLNLGWAIFNNSGQSRGGEKSDFIKWHVLTRIGPSLCEKVRDLPIDRRLDFIRDAVQWSHDPSYKTSEYKDWEGTGYRRLRRVLQLIEFSSKLTPDLLENLIFWSALSDTRQIISEKIPQVSSVRQKIPINILAKDNWILIPSGKFVIGSHPDNELAEENEFPQTTFELLEEFRISRYPITNSVFASFNSEFGRSIKISDETKNHPVVGVSWHDSLELCDWLSNQLHKAGIISLEETVRLPTEAEWEKAARGEYGKEWPWGNQWIQNNCNSWEVGTRAITPVDTFSPQGDSPYGVADMVGNVWEWCQSKLMAYPYANDGREDLDENDKRVLRGGAFNHDRQIDRCAFRQGYNPRDKDMNIGFRPVIVKRKV